MAIRIKEDETDVQQTTENYIEEPYQIVRWIIKGTVSNPDANQWSVFDVNEHLKMKMREGYRLFNTHYLGETPEAYGMLYVLVRRVNY